MFAFVREWTMIKPFYHPRMLRLFFNFLHDKNHHNKRICSYSGSFLLSRLKEVEIESQGVNFPKLFSDGSV